MDGTDVEVGEILAHFGIKGMKWGQRKKRPVTTDAKAKATVKAKVKENKVASVTNAQLQTAIRRMQLEQDFKRLAINEKPAWSRWIVSTVTEIGKREVQAQLGKKVAAMVAKKVATGGAG